MPDFTPDGLGVPVSMPSGHGPLFGELAILPESTGVVVLAYATKALDTKEKLLARQFRRAGLSTLTANLIAPLEEAFPDIHNNVPLLARRLTDFLALLRNRMTMGELPEQPIGLFAVHATSPAAIRIGALRDHDIAAIVCWGGLIDLAGVLYLQALKAPLLLLMEESDRQHIAGNRRALQEVACRAELRIIPGIAPDHAASPSLTAGIDEATRWFVDRFSDLLRADGEQRSP